MIIQKLEFYDYAPSRSNPEQFFLIKQTTEIEKDSTIQIQNPDWKAKQWNIVTDLPTALTVSLAPK